MIPQLKVIEKTATKEQEQQENIRFLCQAWTDCTNQKASGAMEQRFALWLDNGFEPLMIAEAIGDTGFAPRPSFAYLMAIIEGNWENKTLGEYNAAKVRFRCERRRRRIDY